MPLMRKAFHACCDEQSLFHFWWMVVFLQPCKAFFIGFVLGLIIAWRNDAQSRLFVTCPVCGLIVHSVGNCLPGGHSWPVGPGTVEGERPLRHVPRPPTGEAVYRLLAPSSRPVLQYYCPGPGPTARIDCMSRDLTQCQKSGFVI